MDKITQTMFDADKKELHDWIEKTLGVKGTEYGVPGKDEDDDRMANFSFVAAVVEFWLSYKKTDHVSIAEASYLLSLKHEASVVKYLAEIGDGKRYTKEQLQEKFGDRGSYNTLTYSCARRECLELWKSTAL